MSFTNTPDFIWKHMDAQLGSYSNLNYEITFKSSALFPIKCGRDLSATITFMNYWRYKTHNTNVSCLITVRDQKGNSLARRFFLVEDDVYQFRFPDIIFEYTDGDGGFIGSCEVEFHSVFDLKYPYPAVTIIYESPKGISSVHMAARAFHSVDDMDRRSGSDAPETGFDIYANDSVTPFACFTNGSRPVGEGKMTMTAFNHLGQQRIFESHLGNLEPFETVFVFPGEGPELDDFLDGEVGFCKINYDSFGVFPRLICGNIYRDRSHLMVTHSYYDSSSRNEYGTVIVDEGARGAFLGVPLVFDEGIDVDLSYYPIQSPGELIFSANFFDRQGQHLATLQDCGVLVSPGNRMLTLRVRDLLQQAEIPSAEASLISIESRPADGGSPSRINFGLNYHSQGQLGTNISISMFQESDFSRRHDYFRWCPVVIREGVLNRLLICALSNEIKADDILEPKLSIYSRSGVVHTETIPIKNQTSRCIRIEDTLAGAGYLGEPGEILWCVLETGSSSISAFYLMASDQGYVGGDHSF